jgi:hypothetical protein
MKEAGDQVRDSAPDIDGADGRWGVHWVHVSVPELSRAGRAPTAQLTVVGESTGVLVPEGDEFDQSSDVYVPGERRDFVVADIACVAISELAIAAAPNT